MGTTFYIILNGKVSVMAQNPKNFTQSQLTAESDNLDLIYVK